MDGSEFQPYLLGRCFYCEAKAYWDEDNYKTIWQGGDPSCLHRLNSFARERSEDAPEEV